MKEVYIIGDVHGNIKTLIGLINKLPCKKEDIYMVGDLIDRGPNSPAVIEYIINNNINMVLGNHEESMVLAYENKSDYQLWDMTYGSETIKQYKNTPLLFKKHYQYLKKQPYYTILDIIDDNNRKLLITHSTIIDILKTKDISFLKSDDILWNRKIPTNISSDYFNVSGHNIVEHFIRNKNGFIKPSFDITTLIEGAIIDDNLGYANIDTDVEKDCLTAISFPSKLLFKQINID